MASLLSLNSLTVSLLPVKRVWRRTCRLSSFHNQQQHVRRRSYHRSSLSMMPEGPEVRRWVDQLQEGIGWRLLDVRFVSGRYTRHGPPEGFQEFAQTMTPWKTPELDVKSSTAVTSVLPSTKVDIVKDWRSKGKFMYIVLDDGSNIIHGGDKNDSNNGVDYQRSIWITLGLTGRFVSDKAVQSTTAAYSNRMAESSPNQFRWYLEFLDVSSQQTRRVYYYDARSFGTLKFSLSRQALIEKLSGLGPDILEESTTENEFLNILSTIKPGVNICKVLMDQSRISGIGNYIVTESLYKANIDPFASLEELDDTQRRTLFRALQATAMKSYQSQQPGSSNSFELVCYGRDYCAKGQPVRKELEGPHGRTIWYVDSQLFVPREERMKRQKVGNQPLVNETSPDATSQEVSKNADQSKPNKKRKPLASYLIDPGWKDLLSDAMSTKSFQDLDQFLAGEQAQGVNIFPPSKEIFAALNLCPLDEVKVVIVGQDPYHGAGQAHGLAFSVCKGVRPPPSLQNIFREAIDDVGIEEPRHGNLENWALQGVLLLNTVLTVRQGEANSHAGKGWELFTDAIIRELNTQRDGLVFLLWGNPAAKKASGVDESRHTVIRASHPSPLGATKTQTPFLGSRCFSRTNNALMAKGLDPIDWDVDR